MAGNVANITLGPSKLFIAPFATAAPTLTGSEADFGTFTAVGFTQDGIEIDYTPTYKAINVDELMGMVKNKLISHKLTVGAKLSETTLANLAFAAAGATTVSGTEVTFGTVTDAPEYRLGWIGGAANGGTRQMLVFRCVAIGAVKTHVQRKGEIIYQVSFEALSDSAQSPITKDLCDWKDTATPYVYA